MNHELNDPNYHTKSKLREIIFKTKMNDYCQLKLGYNGTRFMGRSGFLQKRKMFRFHLNIYKNIVLITKCGYGEGVLLFTFHKK